MASDTETASPQPAATPPPWGAGGSTGKGAGLVVLALVLLAGAGVVGYLIGDSAADASGAKKEGRQQGETVVRAQYRPGTAAYNAIFDLGHAAGSRSGRQAGLALGVKQGQSAGFERGHTSGQAQGVADGANAALGNLPSWQTGSGALYRVRMGPGAPSRVPPLGNAR